MSACQRDNVANQLKNYNTNNSNNNDVLTASNGCPVDSLTASLTDGPLGNIPLKDFTLIDHLAAFDRERIPERVVHAKGEER
jgi:catalase